MFDRHQQFAECDNKSITMLHQSPECVRWPKKNIQCNTM